VRYETSLGSMGRRKAVLVSTQCTLRSTFQLFSCSFYDDGAIGAYPGPHISRWPTFQGLHLPLRFCWKTHIVDAFAGDSLNTSTFSPSAPPSSCPGNISMPNYSTLINA